MAQVSPGPRDSFHRDQLASGKTEEKRHAPYGSLALLRSTTCIHIYIYIEPDNGVSVQEIPSSASGNLPGTIQEASTERTTARMIPRDEAIEKPRVRLVWRFRSIDAFGDTALSDSRVER